MVSRAERRRLPLIVRGDPWLYTVARLLLAPLAIAYGRLDFSGAGELPASGPVLVVANHPSDADPIFVALPHGRPLRFLANAAQFKRPFVGWCMRRLGAVALDRNGRPREGLTSALELLRKGEAVCVFPEGDVTPGAPGRFESGAAFLAAHSGAPVLPVRITGAEPLLRGGWWRRLPAGWARRPRIRVVAGAPFCMLPGPPHDYRVAAEQLSDRIRELAA